jgi:hypothetical protein
MVCCFSLFCLFFFCFNFENFLNNPDSTTPEFFLPLLPSLKKS